ncbi:MAG: hypothetical protein ACREML_09290, partial [Vulcanimicrobiaceae bacterium]
MRAPWGLTTGTPVALFMLLLGAVAMVHPIPDFSWSIGGLVTVSFGLTPLGSLFVIIAGLVAVPVSLYSASLSRYVKDTMPLPWFAGTYVLVLLSVIGIFTARDVVAFL